MHFVVATEVGHHMPDSALKVVHTPGCAEHWMLCVFVCVLFVRASKMGAVNPPVLDSRQSLWLDVSHFVNLRSLYVQWCSSDHRSLQLYNYINLLEQITNIPYECPFMTPSRSIQWRSRFHDQFDERAPAARATNGGNPVFAGREGPFLPVFSGCFNSVWQRS